MLSLSTFILRRPPELQENDFYPRPVLAFGYCRCLRLSVRPCVNHLLVRAITQDLFKLWSPNWASRSNLTSKSKFTLLWACLQDNSSPVQTRINKFGPEGQNTLIKIPIVLGVDWTWEVKFNLISKSCLFASPFASLKYLQGMQKQSLLNCSASHMAPQLCWFPYARRKGHSMDREPV